jgi:hypothetical protein
MKKFKARILYWVVYLGALPVIFLLLFYKQSGKISLWKWVALCWVFIIFINFLVLQLKCFYCGKKVFSVRSVFLGQPRECAHCGKEDY